jgi:hypothetical protein
MAEIHIFYPASGAPIVQNEYEAVKPGEHVRWHFHTVRTDIQTVKVKFTSTSALFFPTSSGPVNEFTKNLSTARFIWGVAPDLEGGNDRSDKYEIRAYNSSTVNSSTEITDIYIDPTIITEKPRP